MKEIAFLPRTFVLPMDSDEWRKECAKNFGRHMYIAKPIGGARGKGVHLIRQASMAPRYASKDCIVQRYLKKPYLINEYKFDIRLYVVVTCVQPLRQVPLPFIIISFGRLKFPSLLRLAGLTYTPKGWFALLLSLTTRRRRTLTSDRCI